MSIKKCKTKNLIKYLNYLKGKTSPSKTQGIPSPVNIVNRYSSTKGTILVVFGNVLGSYENTLSSKFCLAYILSNTHTIALPNIDDIASFLLPTILITATTNIPVMNVKIPTINWKVGKNNLIFFYSIFNWRSCIVY